MDNDHDAEPEGEMNGRAHCLVCRLPVILDKERKWQHQSYPSLATTN